jgi:hypothetical protein
MAFSAMLHQWLSGGTSSYVMSESPMAFLYAADAWLSRKLVFWDDVRLPHSLQGSHMAQDKFAPDVVLEGLRP